jgi:exonuclease VII small subunit
MYDQNKQEKKMNQIRREKINATLTKLKECVSKLESVKDDEDDARDNLPPNLQNGDAYQQSEECSDALQDAIDGINEAIDELEKIT